MELHSQMLDLSPGKWRSVSLSLSHTPTATLPCTVGHVLPDLWSNSSDLTEMMEVGYRTTNKTVQLKSFLGTLAASWAQIQITYIYNGTK